MVCGYMKAARADPSAKLAKGTICADFSVIPPAPLAVKASEAAWNT